MSKLKTKQINTTTQPYGRGLMSDGNSGVTFTSWDISVQPSGGTSSGVIPTGTTFPGSPSSGSCYYRTDDDILYVYDGHRAKWLSADRDTFTCGRSLIGQSITGYLEVGGATMNSTTGFVMPQNGTIVLASVSNDNTLTGSRTVDIRVNNSTTNRVQLTMTNTSQAYTNAANLDFSAGDEIQVVAVSNGTNALNNVMVFVVVAWRH